MAKTIETWFAIVNPVAGSGKTLKEWDKAEKLLKESGIQFVFNTPQTIQDSKEQIQTACKAGYRHFLAVGGDGTIHNMLKSIAEYVEQTRKTMPQTSLSDFYIAALPIGSGNDWLKSHNISKNHEEIISLISNGCFAPQDVIKVTARNATKPSARNVTYMANIGGYNFDANVCEVVNAQKSAGKTSKLMYIKALKAITFHQKPYRTKLLCDGKTVFDDLLYSISVGNGTFSGGGLCQTPSAVMNDGILDIMVAPKFPLWKVFFNISKLLNKRTEQIRFLKFFKAGRFEIQPMDSEGQLVEADGEIVGRSPAVFEILPQRINALHKGL